MALSLSQVLKLVFGTPWSLVSPPRARPPRPNPNDGRTAGLELLGDYLCYLTYWRRGASEGAAVAVQVPRDNWFVEQEDDVATVPYPSITAVQEQEGAYEDIGLQPYVDEDTVDVYGPGTVLQWVSSYREDLVLEVRARTKQERRAIVAGIEVALSPVEQAAGIRLRLRGYYDQNALFTLLGRQLVEDPDSARHRRVARVKVRLRVNVVRLIAVERLKPSAEVCVEP